MDRKAGIGLLGVLLGLSVGLNMMLIGIFNELAEGENKAASAVFIGETMDSVLNWGENRIEIYSQEHEEIEVHETGEWEFVIVPLKGRHRGEKGLGRLEVINHGEAFRAICFTLVHCDAAAGRKGLELLREIDPEFDVSLLWYEGGDRKHRRVSIDEICELGRNEPAGGYSTRDAVGDGASQFEWEAGRYGYFLSDEKKYVVMEAEVPVKGAVVPIEEAPREVREQVRRRDGAGVTDEKR
ncbi:hypothetical protein STSP2_01188 [Anaerohalosphaera lusitana]|uniref:Uncharacterized protein n=1 Tax=Anaerohalosphaera lusitana TaxID=1936003 RepID=A0A1U9NJW8_9BACT|nr:hypothetical protein [Anaerohalosphaera lusitana]AQT68034.1 hypothetical protein STSP2_01188 [Anaerohalosphaera lusitana]